MCAAKRHLKNLYFIDSNAYAFDKRQLKEACSMRLVCVAILSQSNNWKLSQVSVSEMVAGNAGKPVGYCSTLRQAGLVGWVALSDWLVGWLQRLSAETFGCRQRLTPRYRFRSTHHLTSVCISFTERSAAQPKHVWLQSRRNLANRFCQSKSRAGFCKDCVATFVKTKKGIFTEIL